MKAVESSLSYRSIRSAYHWAERVARHSVAGRTLARLSVAAGPVFADSRIFGTGRIGSSTLDEGLPLSFAAFARPATAIQVSLAAGSPGRAARKVSAAAGSSVFADGAWLRLIGAGSLGLGLGLLSEHSGTSILLILFGLVLALAGPRVLQRRVAGKPWSLRDVTGLREVPGIAWVTMLLCVVAGVLAGAAPAAETRVVVALVLAFAAVGVVVWRPEAIFLLIAAFPWFDWAARSTLGGLGPLWDDLLLVVAVGLVLWSVLVSGRVKLRTVPIALPVLAMLAAAVGSIVVRRVPSDVGVYALRVLFEPILFYFVGFLLPKNVRWLRWTIGVFLLSCTALALHGLYQYITHTPMPAAWVDVTEMGISTRAFSVVQNPNVLGGVLTMGALLSGSLALSRSLRSGGRLLASAACVTQLAGLAVTFSRGAWLGLVVGAVATILLAYRRYLLAAVGAAVIAWFALPGVFVQRLLFTFSSAYAQQSSAGLGRLYRWGVALDHVIDHPLLGLGLGTFGGTTAYMFGYWALWVDNFYLQMAAEGGLLVLVFFLWLLLRGAKGLVRGHRMAQDPYLKAATAGMFGAFLGVIVANAFEADWETLAVGVEFWFLAGLITSAAFTESTAAIAGTGAERSADGSATSDRLAVDGRTESTEPGEAAT